MPSHVAGHAKVSGMFSAADVRVKHFPNYFGRIVRKALAQPNSSASRQRAVAPMTSLVCNSRAGRGPR